MLWNDYSTTWRNATPQTVAKVFDVLPEQRLFHLARKKACRSKPFYELDKNMWAGMSVCHTHSIITDISIPPILIILMLLNLPQYFFD